MISFSVWFCYVILAIFLYKLYKILNKTDIPSEWQKVGQLSAIYLYPFKGGRGLNITSAICTKQGLHEADKVNSQFRFRDRSFAVYNEVSCEVISGRNYSEVVLAELSSEGEDLVSLKAPGMESIVFRVPKRSPNVEITVKQYRNEEIKCLDCGTVAAAWISRFLLKRESGLRLAYNDGAYSRDITKVFAPEIKYFNRGLGNNSVGLNAELTSVLLLNQSSIRELNDNIGNGDITELHFRPNLVVDGNIEPFAEDNWLWIKIGNVILKNVMDCPRCIFTLVNPQTGMRRTDGEPLKTLRKLRKCGGISKTPEMGALVEVVEGGILTLGQSVYIVKNNDL